MLSTSRMDPKRLNVDALYLPILEKLSKEVYMRAGWSSKHTGDLQAQKDFRFGGKVFKRYLEEVFGRKIEKIYFPAAYVGKVAKTLSEAGFDVFASDVSKDWVRHLQSIGLCAERRSFEEIPQQRFDAVVSFEPYCVDETIPSYLAILRMLSRGLPYVGIAWGQLSASMEIFSEGRLLKRPKMFDDLKKRKIVEEKGYFPNPLRKKQIIRIAYDYGADYKSHLIYSGGVVFEVECILPKPNAKKRASLDLSLLEEHEKWASGDRVNLRELATAFKTSVEKMAAAVYRLKEVLTNRLELGRLFERTEHDGIQPFGFMLTDEIPGIFIHRVEIEK